MSLAANAIKLCHKIVVQKKLRHLSQATIKECQLDVTPHEAHPRQHETSPLSTAMKSFLAATTRRNQLLSARRLRSLCLQ